MEKIAMPVLNKDIPRDPSFHKLITQFQNSRTDPKSPLRRRTLQRERSVRNIIPKIQNLFWKSSSQINLKNEKLPSLKSLTKGSETMRKSQGIESIQKMQAKNTELKKQRYMYKRVPTKYLYSQLDSTMKRSKKLVQKDGSADTPIDIVGGQLSPRNHCQFMQDLVKKLDGIKPTGGHSDGSSRITSMFRAGSFHSTIDLKTVRKELEQKYERFVVRVKKKYHPAYDSRGTKSKFIEKINNNKPNESDSEVGFTEDED